MSRVANLKGFAHDRDLDTGKEEWLTPPEILKAFGPFDLDPCAPRVRPWPMATNHFTEQDNGLLKVWSGLVWCNPPYGSKTGEWLARCAEHGNALALTFARTETAAFHDHVWPKATSLFFIRGRLSFFHVDGRPGGTSGAPSVLIAYGKIADGRINTSKMEGRYVQL